MKKTISIVLVLMLCVLLSTILTSNSAPLLAQESDTTYETESDMSEEGIHDNDKWNEESTSPKTTDKDGELDDESSEETDGKFDDESEEDDSYEADPYADNFDHLPYYGEFDEYLQIPPITV